MKYWKIFLLFKIISTINSIEIATIRDVYFNPIGNQLLSTITKHFHSTTCQECLCDYWSNRNTISYLLMNCFPNGTCQYFSTFPTVYSYEKLNGTKIYFLEDVYPQQGSCCSANFNDIFQRVKTSVPKRMDLDLSPGSFGYDPEHDQSQAIVIDLFSNNFVRFNPFTLEKQDKEFIPTTTTISLYKNLIFSALSGYPTIYVFNSSTMNSLVNITYPTLSQTRKFLFLNNGQTLIATSQSNRSLTIFDINPLVNYRFQQILSFPTTTSQSLAKVDDKLFYASGFLDSPIYSYEYENNTWNIKNFVNRTSGTLGGHIIVDDCQRVWQISIRYGIYVYDSLGNRLASWNMNLGFDSLYDILILPNYIVLVGRYFTDAIFSYDPQIFCTGERFD